MPAFCSASIFFIDPRAERVSTETDTDMPGISSARVSGPAVTVGEEIAYSQLAGDDPGSLQGLDDAEIDRRIAAFTGPHGYDPAPTLASMTAPSFWVLGERDRSIPLRQTVAALTRLRDGGRPIALHVIQAVNHGMRDASTGRPADMWPPIIQWLQLRKIL